MGKKKGKDGAARGGFGLQSAEPTSGHMVMSTLVRHELAQHVVTTNLDGLHRKSGLQHHRSLTCLHGDIYIERCTACAHEIERDYHVRNSAPRRLNVHDHSIGTCPKCGSKPPRSYTGRKGADGSRKGLVTPTDKNCGTKDTHINFGESLDDIDWDEAERVCEAAALCIVVGTSMSLDHVTHMPFMSGRTVIINLQKTPYDKQAHLRIFAHAEARGADRSGARSSATRKERGEEAATSRSGRGEESSHATVKCDEHEKTYPSSAGWWWCCCCLC